MDDLLKQLQSVVVTRELDLTELDEAYQDEEGGALRLPFRVNITRGQNRQRWDILAELNEIQKEREKDGLTLAQMQALNSRLVAWHVRWKRWWAGVLMTEDKPAGRWERLLIRLRIRPPRTGNLRYCTAREVFALADAEPDLWEWITARILTLIKEYEGEAVLKASGGLTATTTEPANNDQSSTDEPTTQDT